MKARLLFSLLLTPFVPAAVAQDNPVLPDLAPREVEITGELTIRFPSLRRQPLVGFNPPPRIPDVPESRRPFAEDYLQRRADLPHSPLTDPAGPEVSPYASGPRFDGSIEAGAGIYAQRYLDVDLASRAASRVEWQLKAGYSGRSGFSPVTAVDEATASYDLGQFRARVRAPLGDWHVGGETSGSIQSWSLYAALPSAAAVSNPAPDRSGRSGSASGWLAKETGRLRLRFDAGIGGSRFETDVFDPLVRIDPRTDRSDLATGFGLEFESGSQDRALVGDAMYEGVSLDGAPVSSPDVTRFSALAGARLAGEAGLRVRAGLRIIGFDADRAATGAGKRTFTWLAPDFRVEAAPHADVRVVLENAPSVAGARLDDLYRTNPFAVDSPSLEAELWPIDATAMGTATMGRVEVSVGARWRMSPNRRYFERSTTNLGFYERGISVVSYGRARELGAQAEASLYLGSGFRLRFGGQFRDGTLTRLDAEIPYFASWTVHTMLSSAFDSGRGLVQVTGRVEGSRAVDTSGDLRLDPFADLDLVASYRVSRAASAVLRLENLGGDKAEWDGYIRPSPLFTAGLLWQF